MVSWTGRFSGRNPRQLFVEGSGKIMNTIPPNDVSYFELIDELVQREPAEALDPEIMGSLAAIGIVKGKPFQPDARMRKILTEAAAIGTATGRTLNWRSRESEGFYYYPDSAGMNMLFVGGYNFETRSMLETPQRYPRAGSQSYPSPAAKPNADGSTTVYFGPNQPDGVERGNWIQTVSGKGWNTIVRLYSPLQPFF